MRRRGGGLENLLYKLNMAHGTPDERLIVEPEMVERNVGVDLGWSIAGVYTTRYWLLAERSPNKLVAATLRLRAE